MTSKRLHFIPAQPHLSVKVRNIESNPLSQPLLKFVSSFWPVMKPLRSHCIYRVLLFYICALVLTGVWLWMCCMNLRPLEPKIYDLFRSLVVSCRFYSIKTFRLDLGSNIINLLSGWVKITQRFCSIEAFIASIKQKNQFPVWGMVFFLAFLNPRIDIFKRQCEEIRIY